MSSQRVKLNRQNLRSWIVIVDKLLCKPFVLPQYNVTFHLQPLLSANPMLFLSCYLWWRIWRCEGPRTAARRRLHLLSSRSKASRSLDGHRRPPLKFPAIGLSACTCDRLVSDVIVVVTMNLVSAVVGAVAVRPVGTTIAEENYFEDKRQVCKHSRVLWPWKYEYKFGPFFKNFNLNGALNSLRWTYFFIKHTKNYP